MADRPTTDIPSSLPVLPLRETVAFPLSVMPLAVNRPVSMDAVNRALSGDRMVFLALQASNVEDPEPADVRLVGTVGVIRQMARAAGGIQIIIEGLQRAKADSISRSEQTMTAQIKPMPEHADGSVEVDAYVRRLQEQVDRALSLSSGLSQELRGVVASIDDPLRLVYLLASLLDMPSAEKQAVLEADPLIAKLEAVSKALAREIALLEVKGKIESQAQQEMTDAQRQYFLRQQLKAIQTELGEGEADEIKLLREKVAAANLPEHVQQAADRELDRLARMNSASPDYQMTRTYLDWLRRGAVERDHRGSARSGGSSPRARRGPLRPREGQGAHRRIPGGPQAEGRHEGADSLLRRPARRRQDVARPVDRARDEPQVRAALARRRARRGRNPRPPADVHRRAARPHRAGDEAGRRDEPGVHARRDRQARRRVPGRPRRRPARGARPGAEPLVPRPLPGSDARSLARAVHRDGESARHAAPGAARPHGDHLGWPATPKRTSATSRARTCFRGRSASTACPPVRWI